MISFTNVRFIASKELLEFIRDWRTIMAIILIPLFLFPVLAFALPGLVASEMAELDQYVLDVEIQGSEYPDEWLAEFNNSSMNLSYASLPDVDFLSNSSNTSERFQSGNLDAILRVRLSNDTYEFAIIFDSTSELSMEARARLIEVLSDWEDNEVRKRIEGAGLDADSTLNPLVYNGSVSESNTASQGEQSGQALSLIVPLVLTIWTASIAMQPSIDMTAGERERGTMEALLGLPLSRFEIMLGKWGAVSTIAGIGVVFQIAGLLFAINVLAQTDVFGIPELSVYSIFLLLIAVLLLSLIIVAFELALAMGAKSAKEAGTILAPMLIFITIPALLTSVINLEGIESFWFAVPILNLLLAMRELLVNEIDIVHALIWIISSIFYATLSILYASRQFNREDLVITQS